MLLRDFLEDSAKADLQAFYLFWLPKNGMTSERNKLTQDLLAAMSNYERVRERFDTLGKSHRAFLTSLLSLSTFTGTLEDVRTSTHGRTIEPYEFESVVKSLQDGGFIRKERRENGTERAEVFTIPDELGTALLKTVAIESRDALEMLRRPPIAERSNSLRAEESRSVDGVFQELDSFDERVAQLSDPVLRARVSEAAARHQGLLSHSQAASGTATSSSTGNGTTRKSSLFPSAWREELESLGIGTIGVLNLRDYGIRCEEEALVLFQDVLSNAALIQAAKFSDEHDVEVHVGSDFMIDLELLLERVRTERLEVTREGKIYKKTEERLRQSLTTTRYQDLFEGSTVHVLLDACKKLRFFELEGNRLQRDPIRRRAWKAKSLADKFRRVFELFQQERSGSRWSFHQERLRRLFIEMIQEVEPGSWLGAQDFITGIVGKYLSRLDSESVREEFRRRCEDDFNDDALCVPLSRLSNDLVYWVVQRLALLGIIDVGLKDGVVHALRLSETGLRFFGIKEWIEGDQPERPAMINPDFEVLVFPGLPGEEEANLSLSRFSERLESDRVKRYRLTRESVKRGVVAGLTSEEILEELERHSRSQIPPNVEFSLREWTEGVEFVRSRKVSLLTSATEDGMDRMVEVFDERGIAYERLNETATAIRGTKNEKAVRDLKEHFRRLGLYVE